MQIRPITRDEVPTLFRTFLRTMGFGPPSDAVMDVYADNVVLDRSLAAFDGDQIVGTTYSHLFDLTLPGGGRVPSAGVTAVSVVPTHRRQGILRRLMERQLREARDRGETTAILFASESVIYGRFGYGVASMLADIEIETRYGAYAEPFDDPGRLRFVSDDEADKLLPEVFDRWRRTYPGTTERPAWWWAQWQAERKAGEESIVVHDGPDGAVDGYVRYVVRQKWEDGLPQGTCEVRDVVWLTRESHAALWRHCLSLDLVRRVTAGARPVDEPLRWLLANPRALKVGRYADLLWLRPLDVERLLSSRTYRAEADLVVEVEDATLPEVAGRYRLHATPDGASCQRTDAPADLALPVRDLGAICLGGLTAGELSAVGRVRELTDGAVARADAAFSSVPRPWTPTWF